jgi:pimeloyl-ACP methyl ester carboxylesterase
MIVVNSVALAVGEEYLPGTLRIAYTSDFDGAEDWALFLPGDPEKHTIVYLHGSFGFADEIFVHEGVRDFWLARIVAGRHPLLSLNMRGTSYMSPAATDDLTGLLDYVREVLGVDDFVFLGGSGGASSAMAYAVMHPEQVHAVIAMGMCDIFARLDFAAKSDQPALQELAATVFAAYGGSPDEKPELYEPRSVLAHADRLTMPVVLTMGECDAVIPVEETRKIAAAMAGRNNFTYVEVPGGAHDAAQWVDVDLDTLEVRR